MAKEQPSKAQPRELFPDRKDLTIEEVAARADWFPPNWALPNTEDNRRAMSEMLLAKATEVIAPLPNAEGSKFCYITSADFGPEGAKLEAAPIGLLAELPFAGNKADGPFHMGMSLKPLWMEMKGPNGPPQSLAEVQHALDDPKQFANQVLAFSTEKRSYTFDEARSGLRVIVEPGGIASLDSIQVKFTNLPVPYEDPGPRLGLRLYTAAEGGYRSLSPELLQAWADESGLSPQAICDLALLNTAARLDAPVLPVASSKYVVAAIKSGELEDFHHKLIKGADKVLPVAVFLSKDDENGSRGERVSALMNFPQYLFDDLPPQGLLLAAPSGAEIMAVRLDSLVPPEDVADQITIEQIEKAALHFLDMFACVAMLRGVYNHQNAVETYYWTPAYPDGLRTLSRYSKTPSAISDEEFAARVAEPMR